MSDQDSGGTGPRPKLKRRESSSNLTAKPHQSHDSNAALPISHDTTAHTSYELLAQQPGESMTSVKARRRKKSTIILGGLEAALAIWTIYCASRYFMRFLRSETGTGYTLSIALGTSSTLAAGITLASAIIQQFSQLKSKFRRRLSTIRLWFISAAGFFIASPAIINLILVVIWHSGAPITELDYLRRCHWDIDIVWSSGGSSSADCHDQYPSLAVWLAAAISRVVITLSIILMTTLALFATRRSNKRRRSHVAPTRIHTSERCGFDPNSLYNDAAAEQSASQSESEPTLSKTEIRHRRSPKLRRTPSDTPSGATLVGSGSEDEKLPKKGKSSISIRREDANRISAASAESSSSVNSASPPSNETEYHFPSIASEEQIQEGRITGEEERYSPSDAELKAFQDHIRSLIVSQSGPLDSSHQDNDDTPHLQERVRILNKTISRMPTIESIGSRENSGSTRNNSGGPRNSINSGPPTRTNTLKSTGTARTSSSPQSSLGPSAARPSSSSGLTQVEPMPEPFFGRELVSSPAPAR